ncbi:PIG-L deacetylase family protein [Amycolatopsis sp. NPDC049868]|uniref:PIG-L deacetylase family protein n=1 Tax=Amycolatopsis sp. NPDC049868 TaxID=3363934 RepID=UPI0037B084A8
MSKKATTLVVSPHADDEVLGCASVLGEDTHVLYIGVDDFHVVSAEERTKEIAAVAEAQGFSWDVGEFQVNSYHRDLSGIIGFIESAVLSIRPQRLFSPIPSYNQDHRTVWRAVQAATRRHDTIFFVPEIYLYEEPDNFLDSTYPFKPQMYLDLDLDRKLVLNSLHASQVRGHRSPDVLRAMASTRGLQSKLASAEAFEVVRQVVTR